ncbi:putative AMP-binding protein [Pseudomonas aeruginosa]|nr:putative AMP-binding protein [Pseudomonas aeruginosa]
MPAQRHPPYVANGSAGQAASTDCPNRSGRLKPFDIAPRRPWREDSGYSIQKQAEESCNARLRHHCRRVRLAADRRRHAFRYAPGAQRLRRMLRPACPAGTDRVVLGGQGWQSRQLYLQRAESALRTFRQFPPGPGRTPGRLRRRPVAAHARASGHHPRRLAPGRGVPAAVHRLRPKAIEHRVATAGSKVLVTDAANRDKLDELADPPLAVTVGGPKGRASVAAISASGPSWSAIRPNSNRFRAAARIRS